MNTQIIISKNKQSMEYIPMPCMSSPKVKIMRRNLGRDSELIYMDLLKFIGSQKHKGYWVEWDLDTKELFMLDNDYSLQELEQFLNYCFERDIFSKTMYEKFNILTGIEIQEYWLMCAKKRMRFVEGIIEPFMLVSFEKEVEENQKRFAKFIKIADNKKEGIDSISDEELYWLSQNESELSKPQKQKISEIKDDLNGTPHKPLTSSSIQHSKAISKSVAISKSKEISNKQDYIHPTDVVKTFGNFSSADEIINSISSELLLGGFESEKNNSKSKSSNLTQLNKNVSPPSDSAKIKKTTHPARSGIISIWEKGNNMIYVQDRDNNIAINLLIRKLEGMIDHEGKTITEAEIVQKYTWIWTYKGLLSEFLQKQLRNFTSTEKYFNEIVGDIRVNFRNNQSKQNQAIRQPAYMRFISDIPDSNIYKR